MFDRLLGILCEDHVTDAPRERSIQNEDPMTPNLQGQKRGTVTAVTSEEPRRVFQGLALVHWIAYLDRNG